jgi:hypothetical protein
MTMRADSGRAHAARRFCADMSRLPHGMAEPKVRKRRSDKAHVEGTGRTSSDAKRPFHNHAARTAELLRRQSLLAQSVAVGVAYTAYAVHLTWPLALHPGSEMLGWGGDLVGATALWREFAEGTVPFLPGRVDDLAAPEGLAVTHPLFVATWPSTLLMWSVSAALGAPAAASVVIVIGFVLSGLAMFWLVRAYLGSSLVAAAIGFAFAFRPDTILKAHQGAHMTHQWIWVLLLWRMLVVMKQPSRRNGVLAGAAAVVALSWNPYYLLIGGVFFSCLSATALVVSAVTHRLAAQARAQLWSWGVVVAVVAIYGVVTKAASFTGAREFGFDQLYAFSANPFEYLQPHFGNPLFGWLREPLAIGNAQTDTIMYIGLVALGLAAVACVWALTAGAAGRLRAAVFALVMAAVVAGFFSAPPTWKLGPLTVYSPAYVVGHVTTTWRVYARFGVIVAFATLALAAIGLTLLARSRFLIARGLALVAMGLLVLDTWNGRPGTTSLDPPRIYAVLRDQPAGIVAEYPIVPNNAGDYWPMYFQDAHDKPILNGFDGATLQEARALSLADLTQPDVPGRLASLGVRYVVVNEAAMGRLPTEATTKLEFIRRVEQRSLWRIE